MIPWLWRKLETNVDALITQRIVAFHNAMAERREINPIPEQHGVTGGCRAGRDCSADRSRQQPASSYHPELE
jgi:hypothetical protein